MTCNVYPHRSRFKGRIKQALAMALLLSSISISEVKADCPAAPIGSADDMVISFLAANGTQAAPSTLHASSVKEGMVVYDDTDDALKLCDGTNWQPLALSSAAVSAAGSVQGAVQFRGAGGNLAADDANLYWNDVNNRLGIGTASPGNLLHIVGAGGLSIDDSSGNHINLRGRPGDNAAFINFNDTNNAASARIGLAGNSLRFFTDGGTSERIRILANGNVGIGTTSPSAKVHASGTGGNGGRGLFESTNSWNSLSIKGINGAGVNDSSFLKFEDASGENTFIGLVGTAGAGAGNVGDLRIGVNGVEGLRISKTTSNVGIGTTMPTQKLDVAGTINATNLKIAGEVYAKTFAIRSSDATRKCISANYAPPGYSDDECTWIATGSHYYDSATSDTFPTYSNSTCTTTFDALGLKRIQYSDTQNNSAYFKLAINSGFYDTLLCIKGSSTQSLMY